MFLSDAELVELTGYRQAAKQAAHLRAQRVPFHTNRAGRPVVVRSVWAAINEAARAREATALMLDEMSLVRKAKKQAARAAILEAKAQKAKSARAAAPAPALGLPRRPPKSKSSAMRRSRLRQCTPSWADRNAIRAIYAEAKRLTELTGVTHHVDHYYPIAGRHVSGLHVHHNLRCLPAEENKRKHNHFETEE